MLREKDASQYFVFGGDVKDSLLRDLGLCTSEKTMVAKLDINNYSFDEEKNLWVFIFEYC